MTTIVELVVILKVNVVFDLFWVVREVLRVDLVLGLVVTVVVVVDSLLT